MPGATGMRKQGPIFQILKASSCCQARTVDPFQSGSRADFLRGVDPQGGAGGWASRSSASRLQLPERCLGLQPVYQEFAGLEGGLAMRGRPPPARCGRPAPCGRSGARSVSPRAASGVGLGLDLLQRLLGHAGIVFQGQRIDAVAIRPSRTASRAPGPRTPPARRSAVALGERRELGADVEIGSPGRRTHPCQPPVTGGKKATSRAPPIGASKVAVAGRPRRRNAAPSASASAWPGCAAQPARQVADRGHLGGRRYFLVGRADGALHPGEVAHFHRCPPSSEAPGLAFPVVGPAMWRRPVSR